MKRREFITLLGGAAALPLMARAQQPTVPVIGFLRSTTAAPFAHLLPAFRLGLAETGFIEGQNVAIEQHWADNQLDRLPDLAADLVRRQVAVIVGNIPAVLAAKTATATIPIVFVGSGDPVTRGLVSSLSRPGGNVTGVTFFGGSELNAKRMELLRELVPQGTLMVVLLDPNDPSSVSELPTTEAMGRAVGWQTLIVKAAAEGEFDAAFTKIVQAGAAAMLANGSPFFTSHRRRLIALAARHAVPAMYDLREFVEAGGLISYSASIADGYHQAGVYVGRILKGERPADIPVQRATKIELAINLKTAKALNLEIPATLLARADEVIE